MSPDWKQKLLAWVDRLRKSVEDCGGGTATFSNPTPKPTPDGLHLIHRQEWTFSLESGPTPQPDPEPIIGEGGSS